MGPVGGQGLSLWGMAGGEVLAPPSGSQGPFFLWEGQRGRWRRRWGFMLVNTDGTGFLQSPNTLAPLSSPLCPPFSRGYMVRAPNLSWVTCKGSCQAWIEALKALPAFLPLPSPGLAHAPDASFSPFSLFLKQPGVFPLHSLQVEREKLGPVCHACWHRRLKRCVCDCVTVWEPGLTDRPRATLWHLQVFCSKQPLSALSWTPLGLRMGNRNEGRPQCREARSERDS